LAEGDDLGVFDGGKQGADGLSGAGSTAVAGAVEGDAGGFGELAGPRLDAGAIEDEIHDFPGAARERGDGGIRVFLELEQVAVAVHGGARPGRDDHGQVAGEDLGAVSGDLA
jgi:hypothetical protein